RLRTARGRRGCGVDRHDREARLQPSDRPAGAGGPDWAGYLRRDHGGAARRPRQFEVRAVPAAPAVRPGRAAGAKIRPGFLRVLMDFELTPEQREIQGLARGFARDRIDPNAAAWDREHGFPRELLAELAGLGLMGVCVPEGYGGAGADFVSYIL